MVTSPKLKFESSSSSDRSLSSRFKTGTGGAGRLTCGGWWRRWVDRFRRRIIYQRIATWNILECVRQIFFNVSAISVGFFKCWIPDCFPRQWGWNHRYSDWKSFIQKINLILCINNLQKHLPHIVKTAVVIWIGRTFKTVNRIGRSLGIDIGIGNSQSSVVDFRTGVWAKGRPTNKSRQSMFQPRQKFFKLIPNMYQYN